MSAMNLSAETIVSMPSLRTTAPRSHAPGVSASNIIDGSRKRGRVEDDTTAAAASAGPSSSAGAPLASSSPLTSAASSSQLSGPQQRNGAPLDPEQVTRMGYKLLNVIYHARDMAEEEDPEALLVEPFLLLPDEQLYADYYQVIKKPLTFEIIRQKLDERGYASFGETRRDCELVCQNAKRYNQTNTPIWLKARALHGIIKDVWADLAVAPHAKSTQLDSNVQMLEEGPEGIDPITSQPPSPSKLEHPLQPSAAPEAKVSGNGQQSPLAPSPPSGTSQSRPTRITLKRKAGSSSSGPDVRAHVEEEHVDDEDEGDDGDGDGDGDGDADDGGASVEPDGKRKRPGGRGRKLKSQMKAWVNELWELKRTDGTHHSEFFEELPSRQDYPDYYKIITSPISLKEITAKVKTRAYPSPFSFVSDVRVMIANAKWYNEQESLVWQDADALEKHLEGVVIPALLSEGFTLDPNDTRASVLPPYMLSEASASPQRSLTPMAPRVKIKLATRTSNAPSQQQQQQASAAAGEGLVPMKHERQGSQLAPTMRLPSQPLASMAGASAGPSQSPPALSPSPLPGIAGSGEPHHSLRGYQTAQSPQSRDQALPNVDVSPPGVSASGRPVRTASAKALPGRSQGSPQTLTGTPSYPQHRNGPGNHAPSFQHHGQPSPQAYRGPPPFIPQLPPAGQPGYFAAPNLSNAPPPHAGGHGPPRGYNGLSHTAPAFSPHQPQQPRSSLSAGGPAPPSQPRAPARLTGPPPLSPYLSPTVGGVTREPAVPAFVVTNADHKGHAAGRPFRKALAVGGLKGIRQFAMTVGSDCRECRIIFKVRDFGARPTDEAQGAHAMDIDPAAGSEQPRANQIDSSGAAASPTGAPNVNTTLPDRRYKPRLAATLNGCAIAINWSTPSADDSTSTPPAQNGRQFGEPPSQPGPPSGYNAPAADDGKPVALPVLLTSPFQLPATLHLPLQRGSNILEVTLDPPPPCPGLQALAEGSQGNGFGAPGGPYDAGGQATSDPEKQRERQAQQMRAAQALALPESYRIYITR
ncbi:unnamed protein product [Parajaminaea phylloscopi]